MDHSLSGLFVVGLTSAIGTVLAYAFAGGVVNGQSRSIKLAAYLGRAAVCLTCLYPAIWAWRSPLSVGQVIIGGALWGAAFGAIFFGIGVWYRFETTQLAGGSGGSNDDKETPSN